MIYLSYEYPGKMRVTQKSKTLKGHPFLFGLRQMVTMRE